MPGVIEDLRHGRCQMGVYLVSTGEHAMVGGVLCSVWQAVGEVPAQYWYIAAVSPSADPTHSETVDELARLAGVRVTDVTGRRA